METTCSEVSPGGRLWQQRGARRSKMPHTVVCLLSDSWGRLVLRWSGPWMWALLSCRQFSVWLAASGACEAVAWRQIFLVTEVRSESHCFVLAGACWSSILERRTTEHCSSLSWIVLDYMQVSEQSLASEGVGCAVSPGHGNCTTLPLPWRASQKSVTDPGQLWALLFAQPSVDRHQQSSQTGLACFSCCDVLMSRASDLSGLSCRPFCMYHSLTSDMHAASTESLAVLPVLSNSTGR